MYLNKVCKVTMIIVLSVFVCSCSYDINNRIMTGMDSAAEKIGLKKSDPGKRLASIHRGIYDFYKNYELVYFYSDKDPENKEYEKVVRRYARDSWIKVTTCSVDKKQLPYTREDVYDSDEIRYKYFAVRYEKNQIKAPALFLLLDANGAQDVYPVASLESVPCTGCRAKTFSEIPIRLAKAPAGVIPYEAFVKVMNRIAAAKWPTLQKGNTSHNID